MAEFDVVDGQLALRRVILTTEGAPGIQGESGPGAHSVYLRLALVGMAGAIDVSFEIANARDEVNDVWRRGPTTQVCASSWVPSGVRVHAYRPIPAAHEQFMPDEPQPCDLLHGGACFTHEIDGLSLHRSAELLRYWLQPGGIERVWSELEQHYRQELVPAEGLALRLERERAAGAREAEARALGFQEGAQSVEGLVAGLPRLVRVTRDVLARGHETIPAVDSLILLEQDAAMFGATPEERGHVGYVLPEQTVQSPE